MNDSGSGLPREAAAAHPHATDGDAEVEVDGVLVQTEPADAAGVGTAGSAFHFADDFHGPDFGGAGYRARGESGSEHVDGIHAFLQHGGNLACHMHNVREAFDLHEALDPHRALLGNAAEIIAAEVHEHDVLSFFLGIGEQFLLELHILFRRVPPAARSGDGGELQGILLAAHHDFGRRAEEGDVGEVHVEHVG